MTIATSVRARWCAGLLVAGYATLATIAGTANSPLATRLPAGAHSPAWAAKLARAIGLDRVPRPALIAVCVVLVAALVADFVLLLVEASAGRVRLRVVLLASGASLMIAVAAPLLLSRDVFSYAAYARIFALYHASPYTTVPAQVPGDPFVQVTAAQWLHVHSLYGPIFTMLSGAVVRAFPRSPNAVILAFKVLAGLGVAAATACAALAARALRPSRAPWAAAVVGLNPVLVVHTVGGGHNDALIGAALAGAVMLAVMDEREATKPITVRALAATGLLTIAVLIKAVIAPVLALWLWRVAREAPVSRRVRVVGVHCGLVIGIAAVAFLPLHSGLHTFAPLGTLGGVESWASPVALLARIGGRLTSWMGDSVASVAQDTVVAAFLAAFLLLVWLRSHRRVAFASVADELGPAALLLPLCLPYLLPWYAAWFAPALGLLQDEVLAWIGAAVTALLGLTLIPADPFVGFTTGGVMLGVHYIVAPLMLGLFLVAARRAIARRGRPI